MKKKILAAAVTALLGVGSASAFTCTTGGAADATCLAANRLFVAENPGGVGDLLVAPSYMIGGGWETEIKVVNTNQTRSIVAKVVIHDNQLSAEILDFLIYLTPGDVFVGKLKCLEANAVGICTRSEFSSSDDSVLQLNSNNFASAAAPFVVDSAPTGKLLSNIGYVTIVGSQSFAVAPNKPGVKKVDVQTAWDLFAGPNLPANDAGNDLAGFVTLKNSLNGQSSGLPMVALTDYNNTVKQVVGVDSSLGAPNANSTVDEVEFALGRASAVVPYTVDATSSTLVSFTYPTKLTYRRAQSGCYPFPIWNGTIAGLDLVKVPFSTRVFDFQENFLVATISPLTGNSNHEQDWKMFGNAAGQIPISAFTQGWALVDVKPAVVAANGANCTFTGNFGAPVIVTYMNASGSQITWSYAPGN